MRKLLKNWYLWFAVGVLAIILGAAIDYRIYSDHKFNTVVSALQDQELRNTKEYVKVANLHAEISIGGSSHSASSAQLKVLQEKVKVMKRVVANSCDRQTSDITSTNLDSKVKHLWLSGDQKKYITDAKTVLNDLVPSEYSSEGMCKADRLLVGLDENAIQLLPGVVTIAQIQNNPNMPSAQQINSLQRYATSKVVDYAELKQAAPDTASFYSYIYTLYANIYYELKATEAGDVNKATQYAAKVDKLSSAYDAKFDKFNDAGEAIARRLNKATIAGAKAEIGMIDAQRHNGRLFAKLDYSVPIFWLLDAKLGQYSAASKDNANPSAKNIQQLVSALHDSDLNTLYERNLLQKAHYTSLGNNNSGEELAVTLADGSKLTEKQPPLQ